MGVSEQRCAATKRKYQQHDLSRLAEDHLANIINSVYFGMIYLEDTDDIVRLSPDPESVVGQIPADEFVHIPK